MTWRRLLAVRLVTQDSARLIAFYAALGFRTTARTPIPADEMALLGLAGGGERVRLMLGAQALELDRYDEAGAPYPADVSAADLAFQHIALVTSDAAAAWETAHAAGARAISDGGAVRLPASAGGVTAVKFRDPEGHPLELLQFPSATAEWSGSGMLGIDHSAISVADADASRAFYAAQGLTLGKAGVNQGPTQAALDGVAAPVVDVMPMLPCEAGPHLELLGYRTPVGRPAPVMAANAVAATRLLWAADRAALVRDPDGHRHQLTR